MINCHFLETKKFKTTNICVLLRRKLSREEATKNALIANVLRRSSRAYPTMSALNRRLEELGGAVFDIGVVKKGEEQILQFFLEADNLGAGLDFLREIMLNPLENDGEFDCSVVCAEIENQRNALRERQNDKTEYAKFRLLEEMGEPFGISADGYEEDLQHSAVCLFEHYQTLLRTSPIEILIIGDIDKRAEEVLGIFDIKRGEIAKIPEMKETAFREPRRVRDEQNNTQARLCMGFRVPYKEDFGASRDFYALLLLNEILGASPVSKLFLSVREKDSLCYNINSYIYRFNGILAVQCGADADKLHWIEESVQDALAEIQAGGIPEFSRAVKGISKRFRAIEDSPSASLNFYLSQYMLGVPLEKTKDFINRVQNVTKDEIIKMSETLRLDTVYTCT
ncbi:peptidase M16 [Clostridia bacterium]|nr:peptidase M16 [Clostridia bacterium]